MKMVLKRSLFAVLVLVMIVGTFAACSNGNGGGDASADTSSAAEGLPTAGDVLFTVQGAADITWEEVLYDMNDLRPALEGMRPFDQWDDIFEQQVFEDVLEYMTFNEILLHYAMEMALERRVAIHLFEELGLTLEANFFEDLMEEYFEHFGSSLEELMEDLEEIHLSLAMFQFLNEAGEIQERLWPALTEELSDEDVENFAAGEGILRAMHILVMGDDEETTAQAMAIYEELSSLEGDALLERFAQLLETYGEDPGMLEFTQGYTFAPGVMVPEFYEGTEALEYYAVSAPVRSNFGYHIILRLPIDRTLITMHGSGQQLPLEQFAVSGLMVERTAAARLVITASPTALAEEIVPSAIFQMLDELFLAQFEEDEAE